MPQWRANISNLVVSFCSDQRVCFDSYTEPFIYVTREIGKIKIKMKNVKSDIFIFSTPVVQGWENVLGSYFWRICMMSLHF